MADKQRCPICNGKIFLEYCEDCGFRVVDEDSISSLYNYDPSDYPSEEIKADYGMDSISTESSVREVTPDVNAGEIYPEFKQPNNQYSIPSVSNTAAQNNSPYKTHNTDTQQNPYSIPSINQNNNQNNNTSQNTNPYIIPNIKDTSNNTNNTQNPYQNVNYQNQNFNYNSNSASIGGFIKSEWWKILIVFFFGFIGVVIGFSFINNYRKKLYENDCYSSYIKYMTAVIVINIVLRILTQI